MLQFKNIFLCLNFLPQFLVSWQIQFIFAGKQLLISILSFKPFVLVTTVKALKTA